MVTIQSEELRPGDVPAWDFPEPVEWFFVGSDGDAILQAKPSRRVLLPEFEVTAPARLEARRKLLDIIGEVGKFSSAGGVVIVGVRSELRYRSGGQETHSMVVAVGAVVGVDGSDRRDVGWIPSQMDSTDDLMDSFERTNAAEEIIEE